MAVFSDQAGVSPRRAVIGGVGKHRRLSLDLKPLVHRL